MTPRATFRLAADLAALRADLDLHAPIARDGGYADHCPWWAYVALSTALDSLLNADLSRDQVIEAVLAAVDRSVDEHQDWNIDQAIRREFEERRREQVLGVTCPYCGAEPGDVCRTTGGAQHHVLHRGRIRAWQHLLDRNTTHPSKESA